MKQETFFLISGEGEKGTWEIIKTDNITEVLKKERCNGDRWAHAYRAKNARYDFIYGDVIAYDYETHEEKLISDEDIVDFVFTNRRINNVE